MRKIIKVFLASSIVEFANERMAIENFIRNVSDEFEERYQIKIQPLLCENFDPAMALTRKQDEYNEAIRGSELCFFIFFTKAGEYTKEEFDVAYRQFKQTGRPKIYTYFKVIKDGEAEKSVVDFMHALDTTFGHYYSMFEHIDTVKLRILLSLKLQEMDYVEIKAEDGNCVVDGKPVMPLQNVSEFMNSSSLEKLQKELRAVEEEYYQLKPIYAKGNCSNTFYEHYSKIAAKRENLIKEIEELENQIFQVSLRMSHDEVHGEITARQKEAYRLFELGDYEGCMEVLDFDDIRNDFLKKRARLKEQDLALCRKYIRENETAIRILYAMKDYDRRFCEIGRRYEEIVPIILSEGIELETAAGYAAYLFDQGKAAQAAALDEQLKALAEANGETALMADICRELAGFYFYLGQAEKAEENVRRAIEIMSDMLKQDLQIPDLPGATRCMEILVNSYTDFGCLYLNRGQYSKAQEFYLNSIETENSFYAGHSELLEHHEVICSGLPYNYACLGRLFSETNQPERAEHYYLKAIEAFKKYSVEMPEDFYFRIAESYVSAGDDCAAKNEYEKAQEYYLNAIDRLEKLVFENEKSAYIPALARLYGQIGDFYADRKAWKKAEMYYLKEAEKYEALAAERPDDYTRALSICYSDLAFLYYQTGELEKGDDYSQKKSLLK